jgi:hypothetical protein
MCLNENEARGALSSIFGTPGAFTIWHFLGQSMISMAAHKPILGQKEWGEGGGASELKLHHDS